MALTPINGRVPPQPPAAPSPNDARSVAQRAFFQAALDKAQAGGTVARAAPVATAPARAESRAVQPAVSRLQGETSVPPHPGRILRPGSLIDIKV